MITLTDSTIQCGEDSYPIVGGYFYCDVCGERFYVVTKTMHVYDYAHPVEEVEKTCVAHGYKTYVCTECGETIIIENSDSEETLPGHNYRLYEGELADKKFTGGYNGKVVVTPDGEVTGIEFYYYTESETGTAEADKSWWEGEEWFVETGVYALITYSDGETEYVPVHLASQSVDEPEPPCTHTSEGGTTGDLYEMTIYTEGSCEETGFYWLVPVCSNCGEMDTDVSNWEYVPITDGHAWVWTDVTDYTLNFLEDGKTAYYTAETYEFDAYCAICGEKTSVTFSYETLYADINNGGALVSAEYDEKTGNTVYTYVGQLEYGFEWKFAYVGGGDCTKSSLGTFTVSYVRGLVNGEISSSYYDTGYTGDTSWTDNDGGTYDVTKDIDGNEADPEGTGGTKSFGSYAWVVFPTCATGATSLPVRER